MADPQAGNEMLLRSFARSLRARNHSTKTIASYLDAARVLSSHVQGRDLLELTRGDVEDFIGDQFSRHRAATAAVRFRSLQQFYRWLSVRSLWTSVRWRA